MCISLIHTKSVTGFESTKRFLKCMFEVSRKDKLSGKRFGPFFVKELVGKNAMKVELPSYFNIHEVFHVFHTAPYHRQPSNIFVPVKKILDPVPAIGGEEYIIESILNHRKGRKVYQFLT